MNSPRLSRGSLLPAAVALLLAGILMACGPANMSDQGSISDISLPVAQQDEPEPTATPTPDSTPEVECTRTEGSYPNLDTTLKELVKKYETCELDANGAAALTEEYYLNTVLAGIVMDPSGSAADLEASTKAIKSWLEANEVNPKWTDPWSESITAYGYVPVSQLGALSELDAVQKVRAEESPDFEGATLPSEDAERQRLARSGEQRPTLPTWLKDYNSAIRSEDERLGRLGDLVMAWEAGTYADLDIDIVKYCGVQGEHTNPLVVFHNTPEVIQRVRAWLKAEGLHVFSDNEIVSAPPGIHFPAYELHISKVRELVSIEGVRELFLANCSGEAGPSVSPSKGTGTTVSQGKAAHNATAWQQAGYTGDGVIVSVS